MWMAWLSWQFPRREPVNVADVTEHRGRDDGAHAVDLGHRRLRRRDRAGEAALDLAATLVDALQIVDQVTSELESCAGHRAVRGDVVEDLDRLCCRDFS